MQDPGQRIGWFGGQRIGYRTGVATPLVIGVDAGATSTRCLIATLDGAPVARGSAGGANRWSSAGQPSDTLAAALRSVLSHVDPTLVRLGVVGVPGAGLTGTPTVRRAAEAAWRAAKLGGEVVTVTDLEVAFAAGTASQAGLLLLAGTGAVAAAFREGAVLHRCDGYGWLFGDEGSAVWIGRAALRSVLAGLDGRAPPTALIETVTELLVGSEAAPADPGDHAQVLISAAYTIPPADLGRLAPLVSAAAAAGDPAAREIVDEAVARLLHSLETVAHIAPGQTSPVVLAGSVLLSPGPVADAVRAGVRGRFGAEAMAARDGAAGAAAMAIARLRGEPVPADVHARLTEGAAHARPVAPHRPVRR
jgi:glucosamine kinase